MADVRPFRGIHYNGSKVKDWSAVICPPYDIISPRQQEELYQLSDNNFIRLEYGRTLPQDTATENRYTRAATLLSKWLASGVLATDAAPAFYMHDHYFGLHGKRYRRRNLYACVRLEDWDKMIVRPHEGTLSEPKGDRLSLLYALQANTSPILTMYEDKNKKIFSLLAQAECQTPLVDTVTADGEAHRMWVISDQAVTRQISVYFAEKPLYIADGHHRYESALAYKRDRLARAVSATGEEDFNFAMMSLVDFADGGLKILAPHRLVRGIQKGVLDELPAGLAAFFDVEEFPLGKAGADINERLAKLLSDSGKTVIGLYGVKPGVIMKLTMRDTEAAGKMMPYFHSELYKKLDVSIVDHVLLEELLGLDREKEKTALAYSYDVQDAVQHVQSQEFQLAILLSVVKPELIKEMADAGDKMPRKSTYFYPKAPSGLVLHRVA